MAQSFGARIRHLDSFAKAQDDYRTKTFVGGLITVFCAIFVPILVFLEYVDFQKIDWKPEVVVDTNTKSKMTIDFDISFPKVPCFALNLDIMDSADVYQNNVAKNISKDRLSPKGLSMGRYVEPDINRPADYCGDCYKAAAKRPDGKPICCNSCSAVFAAYEYKSLPPPSLDAIQQCIEEKWSELMAMHSKEGCRVAGKIEVNKIAGNFHFAPGHSYDAYNYHMHDTRFLEGLHLDFSHHIHHLTFGEHHATITNPLDDTENRGSAAERSFKYNVKVVATDFRYKDGKILHTNQFAVTRNENETQGNKLAFPSVFFNYDVSPMIVIYSESKKALLTFFVEICAIIGGVYTVAALLDMLLYNAERKLFQKNQLGKTQ